MIHSLSGGKIKGYEKLVFVKIQVSETESKWLVCDFPFVKVGDIASYENSNGWIERAKIIRVDKNVSSQTSPVPVRFAQRVLKIENSTEEFA